ncbi:hypothetical protein LQ948_15440 [Jiella sp. MQZ9-1]|uniref:Lipoprotein n=1 Tax=Jiella flava TaxID=2816857 RepID=A0A939JXF5_9HYPH|nr:hypothetical protein [Jiella flava]MBO0664027.1 hypothetical protein [Jiella flava]MCD2472599.1 hypothetical protein [Jiella flava]
MATKIARFGPLVAVGVGALLSGCTGSDIDIAMGPNGPVPPENIGSTLALGAPPASTLALRSAAPLRPSPVGRVAAEPLPPSEPISESPLAPPPPRDADTAPRYETPRYEPSRQETASRGTTRLRWETGPQPVATPHRPQPHLPEADLAQTQVQTRIPEPATTRVADGEPPASPPRRLPRIDEEPAADQPLSPEPQPEQRQAALAPPTTNPAPLRPAAMRGTAQPGSARREIQFLPVVGAPQKDAELLARALSEEASRTNVEIRPASGPVGPLRLKGYFSAFAEGNQTVLVYVWDVLDHNDQRVHRFQGQERVAGTSPDPWSRIDFDTLRKVAAETMRQTTSLPADIS